MPLTELHVRIEEIASRAALLDCEDADIIAAEEHASEGCSVCARALVNARDIGAEMAFLEPKGAPSPWLRERLLDRVRMLRRGAGPMGAASPRALAALSAEREPKIFDPSGTVARKHIAGADEAERASESAELGLTAPAAKGSSESMARVLAQVERILGFPLHFVSIMRGDRVGYRVQRGLSPEAASLGGLRREMTFCTHCVSSQAPLVVNNSLAEPFFRGNPAVSRHRIRAYVGVPLRTSRGIIIGTLCALDYRPRVIPPEFVRVLELFAKRVVAEIERPRGTSGLADLVVDPPVGAVYRRPFFEDLLSIELARLRSESRPTSIIVASGRGPSDLDAVTSLLRDDEIAGEISEDTVGVLLSKVGADDARTRCAALASALGGGGEEKAARKSVVFAACAPDASISDTARWLDAARALIASARPS